MSLKDYLKYTDTYAGDVKKFVADLEAYTATAVRKLEDTINSLAPEIKPLFEEMLNAGYFAEVGEKGKSDLVAALNTLIYEESPEIAANLLAHL